MDHNRPSIIVTPDGKKNCRCTFCLRLVEVVFEPDKRDFSAYDEHRANCQTKSNRKADSEDA